VRALITGVLGQDGTLLRRHLEDRGYEVLGIARAGKADAAANVAAVSLTDSAAVRELLSRFTPDRVYHLAACHHSADGAPRADIEHEMVQTNFVAVQVLLDAIRAVRPGCRLLIAGSSQMYRPIPGSMRVIDESTPMDPGTFYGRTKAWARELTTWYRERHEIHAGMVILFNHESELRAPAFVTRKITQAAAAASVGAPIPLHLRDIGSSTDWSAARDFVAAMQLATDADFPQDFVLASGAPHTVEDVLRVAFGRTGLDWRKFTTFDTPTGPRGILLGNSAKAKAVLGWQPRYSFEDVIVGMVEADLARLAAVTAS
jgi:GDPmannose 4,6-dehydratase